MFSEQIKREYNPAELFSDHKSQRNESLNFFQDDRLE
jgi:hypothetical protein